MWVSERHEELLQLKPHQLQHLGDAIKQVTMDRAINGKDGNVLSPQRPIMLHVNQL